MDPNNSLYDTYDTDAPLSQALRKLNRAYQLMFDTFISINHKVFGHDELITRTADDDFFNEMDINLGLLLILFPIDMNSHQVPGP